MLDCALAARLAEAGVDPQRLGDPAQAWSRLYDRFGRRATLLDRFELEAAARGVNPVELDDAVRQRVTLEVVRTLFPGFELMGEPSRDPVEVVPHDPTWAARFTEWHARLSDALGNVAVRIDHIGSTSVPGLSAKPVVDVQVIVRDLEAEDAYFGAIESTGLRLRSRDERHRYFRHSGDSPRVTQVHVCAHGSEWERDHLLFRDYLRTHGDVAEAYGSLKQELARRHRFDRIAYTDAKTEFILDALERAETWAADTHWHPNGRSMAAGPVERSIL